MYYSLVIKKLFYAWIKFERIVCYKIKIALLEVIKRKKESD